MLRTKSPRTFWPNYLSFAGAYQRNHDDEERDYDGERRGGKGEAAGRSYRVTEAREGAGANGTADVLERFEEDADVAHMLAEAGYKGELGN